MKTLIKSLPKPTKQVEEALFELLANKQVSVYHLINNCRMLCSTKIISILRLDYGIQIESKWVDHVNKFGRPCKYTMYHLKDREEALTQYLEITKQNPK